MRSLDYMVARYAWAQSHTVFHSVLRCSPHRTIPIPLDAHPASLAQAPFARRNCRIGRFSAAALERASAHAPAGACGPYKGPACRPGSCPGVRTPGKSGECRADGGVYTRGRPGKAHMFGPVVHLAHLLKPFPSHSGHLGGQSAAEAGGVPVRAIRVVLQTLPPPRRHDLVVPAETAGNLHDSPVPLHRARSSNRLGLYSGRRGSPLSAVRNGAAGVPPRYICPRLAFPWLMRTVSSPRSLRGVSMAFLGSFRTSPSRPPARTFCRTRGTRAPRNGAGPAGESGAPSTTPPHRPYKPAIRHAGPCPKTCDRDITGRTAPACPGPAPARMPESPAKGRARLADCGPGSGPGAVPGRVLGGASGRSPGARARHVRGGRHRRRPSAPTQRPCRHAAACRRQPGRPGVRLGGPGRPRTCVWRTPSRAAPDAPCAAERARAPFAEPLHPCTGAGPPRARRPARHPLRPGGRRRVMGLRFPAPPRAARNAAGAPGAALDMPLGRGGSPARRRRGGARPAAGRARMVRPGRAARAGPAAPGALPPGKPGCAGPAGTGDLLAVGRAPSGRPGAASGA